MATPAYSDEDRSKFSFLRTIVCLVGLVGTIFSLACVAMAYHEGTSVVLPIIVSVVSFVLMFGSLNLEVRRQQQLDLKTNYHRRRQM